MRSGNKTLGRRGQTLILALAILFLLLLLGTIFVTMVVRNLQRVSRSGETDDALTLSLAGLRHAADQFRTSEEGADWRPRPTEALWRTPTARNAAEAALRLTDPDYDWLSDGGTFQRPFVRVASGRGRFLLRVSFQPAFRPASAASARADLYDPNSGMLHIESIGRPGEFDPNDPTSTADPTTTRNPATPNVIAGLYRKVDAYVPITLLDQLWWITNRTNERGPATLGMPAFRNPRFDPRVAPSATNRMYTDFTSLFQGSIRSNVDLQWQGKNVVRVYPAQGDGVFVKGNLGFSRAAQLRIEVMDDNGGADTPAGAPPPIPPDDWTADPTDNPADDSRIYVSTQDGTPAFPKNPIPMPTAGGEQRLIVADESALRSAPGALAAESTRFAGVPDLEQTNPATGVNRWVQATRDSGGTDLVADGAGTRLINRGWYGLTDATHGVGGSAVPGEKRARGLYLDNFADIQWRSDRSKVKDDWMQRGRKGNVKWNGWVADEYTPLVLRQDGYGIPEHEIAEVQLVPTGIRIWRHDPDIRQMNLGADKGRDRLFYEYDPAASAQPALRPVGQVREFDYPPNGIFYAEGSIRVRGTVPPGVQLNIVSGGTIYIEGNLLKGNPFTSYLGLMARDYLTLNPTAFHRLRPGNAVPDPVADSDGAGTAVGTYHYTIGTSGGLLDFGLNPARSIDRFVAHFQHAGEGDASSSTNIALKLPGANGLPNPAARYDFAANLPPVPPAAGAYDTSRNPNPPHYMFRYLGPGEPPTWWESGLLNPSGVPRPEYERKTFFLPAVGGAPLATASAGNDTWFQIAVGEDNIANQQPYLLSRVAVLPQDQPLPIKIEAVMYAFTGSWFVIPPTFFNTFEADTRVSYDPANNRLRENLTPPAWRTLPENLPLSDAFAALHYPFYNEPLNVDIQIKGSITENIPAHPSEVAAWTSRLWTEVPDSSGGEANDPAAWPPQDPDDPSRWAANKRSRFSPRISYRYDTNLRRVVRVRYLRPWPPAYKTEDIALASPSSGGSNAPGGLPNVDALIGVAVSNNSYVEVLPVLPRLPVSGVIYEGNPL